MIVEAVMKRIFWLILGACVALAGCASAVSTTMQPETGPKVGFAELAAYPENYQGQTKILGGEVMQVQPLGQGSLLSVDQRDLDSHLFPAAGASGGTFLVESDEWLSPNTYLPKSTVTVAGVVAGQKNGFLLLKAKKIHFWEGPTGKNGIIRCPGSGMAMTRIWSTGLLPPTLIPGGAAER